jgi:uncharacterized low-complexity protein
MSKNTMTPAAAVIGAALVGSLSAVSIAQAETNPFTAEQINGGYLMLAGEGSCGEGKCGSKEEGGEGKCGSKDGEGKCGEGKCGGTS